MVSCCPLIVGAPSWPAFLQPCSLDEQEQEPRCGGLHLWQVTGHPRVPQVQSECTEASRAALAGPRLCRLEAVPAEAWPSPSRLQMPLRCAHCVSAPATRGFSTQGAACPRPLFYLEETPKKAARHDQVPAELRLE